MTQVTDKMVDAAWDTWDLESDPDKSMRSTIEAALAAREHTNAGELVQRLRGKMMLEFGIDGLGNEAADAIEELVETLRKLLNVVHFDSEEVHAARAILTRMGVKL